MNIGSSTCTSELPHANDNDWRSSPVDSEYLLETIDGDIGFLCELVEIFIEDYPIQLLTARDAVQTGDSETLENLGHSLRGRLGSLAAPEAARIAGELEQMGANGKASLASTNVLQLKEELARVAEALQALCQI